MEQAASAGKPFFARLPLAGPAGAAASALVPILAALLAAAMLLCAAPRSAFADTNFTIDELSTELTVNPNGSVQVVSRQVLTFSGANRGYTWYLHQPGVAESVRIESISVAEVDDGGTPLDGWTRLQMFDVEADQQGKWPGDAANAEWRRKDIQPWYSYDLSNGMVRSYFPAGNGTYMIEANYTITNYVSVYRDIAELSWRYAHGSLPVDSSDVSLQVVLPVPPDAVVEPGENVIAWGHGPHDGRFEVNEDGTAIYSIDFLETGHYGEAHIIFPSSWMTAMAPNAPRLYTEMHKQEVLAEESQWVDASMRGAAWDYKVRVLCFSLAALVLMAGLIAVLRRGIVPRSRRTLVRVACVLAVEALAVKLLFNESFTVWCLLGAAAVVAISSLFMPQTAEEAQAGADDGAEARPAATEEALQRPDAADDGAEPMEGEGHGLER